MEAAVHGAHASWTHAHTRARQPPALQGARLPRTREQRPGSPPKATPASLPQGSSGFQPPPRSGPALGPGHSLRGLDTRTCADGSPAPGPGSLVTQGGARPAPPATYLPRSRQSRRACASGSRPYSPRAAAATCPAARVRRGAGRAEGRRARGAGPAPAAAARGAFGGRAPRRGGDRARRAPSSLCPGGWARRRSPSSRAPPALRSFVRRARRRSWGSLPAPGPRSALPASCSGRETRGGAGGAGTGGGNARGLLGGGAAGERNPGVLPGGGAQGTPPASSIPGAARKRVTANEISPGAAWRRSAANATGELNPGGLPGEAGTGQSLPAAPTGAELRASPRES